MLGDGERVLQLVMRHGWNATAFQTLEPGYAYMFDDDACVAYVDTGHAWVAAGAPIAAPERVADVATKFVAAARRAGKRACFVATEDRMREATRGRLHALQIAEQPIWDPREWSDQAAAHRSIGGQLKRARNKGVRVRLCAAAELEAGPTHEAIAAVAGQWLQTRDSEPMRFLLHVDPFAFGSERRCFVAEVDREVVAFAGVIPVPARQGWFIEDLVRSPRAPNGTTESLVDAVMRWAQREGCSWVTLGAAPLAGPIARWLRLVRRGARIVYDFEGLHAFKAKLRPREWMPIYLQYPRSQGAFRSLSDTLAAFTGHGVLGFGVRALLRAPAAIGGT
jgi:phosphatidylglycerol lysyltransferase